MKRTAKAHWTGTIKDGQGHLTTQSETLNQTPYSFKTRFTEEKGTNPEELIAAAHAGCFTMKLSANLTEKGFEPKAIETSCTITLDNGTITSSHLDVEVEISGIDQTTFDDAVEDAEKNCPISKLLNADISVDSKLK